MEMTSRDVLQPRGTADEVSVLEKKEKPKRPQPKAVPYRGPQELVDEIDRAAAELELSRNEAMTQLLRYALAEHRREQSKKSKK